MTTPENLTPKTEEKKKFNIYELISSLENFATEIENSPESEVKELLEKIKDNREEILAKVDAYHYTIEKLELDIKLKKEIAKAFLATAKVQENKIKRMKEFFLLAMKTFGYERLSGDLFTVSKVDQTRYKIESTPTKDDFMKNQEVVNLSHRWKIEPTIKESMAHPDLVEPVYDWDEAKIKADKPKFEKLGILIKKASSYVKFSVKKEK